MDRKEFLLLLYKRDDVNYFYFKCVSTASSEIFAKENFSRLMKLYLLAGTFKYQPPRPKHRVAWRKREQILARASVQLASAPLTANSRISRGRINPPFAKYARTIRSAMRDPEISPWQSSCFRRPLARDGSAGVWSGGRGRGGGGGGAEGRRTRERAGGVVGNAYLSRAETHPRALSRSLAYLLALISPGAHERSLACRSSVLYADTSRRDERALDCTTGHSLPHLLSFKTKQIICSTRRLATVIFSPLNFSPRYQKAAVWHVFS